jgi:hypothetical protein
MDGDPSERIHADDLSSIAGRPIHAFPSTDWSFRRAVIVALGDFGDGRTLKLDGLEELLRNRYPGVRVVEQTNLASIAGESAIYVFRDGSVGPQAGDGPGTMRYISQGVAVQQACARNLAARRRSKALVARAIVAVQRSRSLRAAESA